MTNAERILYQIDQIMMCYGFRRAPYKDASAAVLAIKDLVGVNCTMCAFRDLECTDDEGLKCHEGIRQWLNDEENKPCTKT